MAAGGDCSITRLRKAARLGNREAARALRHNEAGGRRARLRAVAPAKRAELTVVVRRGIICLAVDDYEVIALELSGLGEKLRSLEERLAEVEKVNARLEDAALITARALAEISQHWDAVYEAMRRAEAIDPYVSESYRDQAASRARRESGLWKC